MAAGEEVAETLRRDAGLRLEHLKGRAFEACLVAATLVGILSLIILFGYVTLDALGPLAASPRWFLLYLGTLVAPTAAFTLYVRRRPAARAMNARAFAVVLGGLAGSLATYAVVDALSPYDVLIYLIAAGLPPLLVRFHERRSGDHELDELAGPAVPVSIILGAAVAALLYPFIRPFVGLLPRWMAFYAIVALPAALGARWLAGRRRDPRQGRLLAGAILGGPLLIAAWGIVVWVDPSLWIVLYVAFVLPVGYVVVDAVRGEGEGGIGVLGPFVVAAGIAIGVGIERAMGIHGPDAYLTPTLLLHSWDGLNASNAGVYPQIVGSIVIVGFMAIMAFPVGIGAAVYLEEYAPTSGWGGRLASLLEVNIANLAGVPSVVYGLLGLALFRNALGFGPGLVVAAAGTLGLLILPIVVVAAQEAVRSVPDSLRQASYGMGASRWQTLRNVVFPEAIPGILTGTILALGRAIGETAPLVIIAVATTSYVPPSGLFSGATALPLQIFASASNAKPEFRTGVVAATAVVLLALMLLMNAAAIVVRNRYEREL